MTLETSLSFSLCLSLSLSSRKESNLIITESDRDGGLGVTRVLAKDLCVGELPELGSLVGRGADEIGGVGGESAVPDPPLVADEGLLGMDEVGLAGLVEGEAPEGDGLVGGGGGEGPHVGGEEGGEDVALVGGELLDQLDPGGVLGGDGVDEALALVVGGHEDSSVGGDGDRAQGDGHGGEVGADDAELVGGQVAHADLPRL